jgi:hypothetical protein
MIITACIPPEPPPVTAAEVRQDNCRTFSSIDPFLKWAKEHGFQPKRQDWRWP